MLEHFNDENKAVGLEMNLSKTQVMVNNHIDDNDQIITINGFQLKVVTSYTYLDKEYEAKRRISFG